jgi:hypothetical protein
VLTRKKNETENLFAQISQFRGDSKSLKYSKIEYDIEQKSDCDLTEFIRYFDGENSYSFHFDLTNSICSTVSLKSNLIKGNTVTTKYSSDKEIEKDEKIKFDSSGKTSINQLEKGSFLAFSWSYEPKDLNDIL